MKLKASLVSLLLAVGCAQQDARLPTGPSAVSRPLGGAHLQQTAVDGAPTSGPAAFPISLLAAFPDRREPVEFRTQLEGVYQARGAQRTSTFVDIEGTVIWTTEYIRYRLSNCSDAESISKVAFEIANLNSPGPPECGSVAPFPDRRDAFRFRVDFLEPQYRDVLRKPLQQLFVNAEGDVIWTMEYLRYRVGNCSHAEATAKVNMDIGGAGPQPVCSGSPLPTLPPTARFDVIANPGTNVNRNQCSVRSMSVPSGGSRNFLLCSFDATGSTPRPGITSYRWTIEVQDSGTDTDGEVLQNISVPCGSFGNPAALGTTTEKNVRLTVTSPGGSSSISRDVTFVKTAPC
jgi:hypothetical protein